MLTDLNDALTLVLEDAHILAETEPCVLAQARGRVLAEAVTAKVAVPFDDNSAMDGYAMRSEDSNRRLTVTQRIPAGLCGLAVAPGTAARIFTGAPIPPGADAVAMQENCELDGSQLLVRQALVPGENVRARGQDIGRIRQPAPGPI